MPRNSDPGLGALARLKNRIGNPRVLLVAKISVAVAISALLAPFLPGATDDFPYYAPVGALLSMHPTLMGSFRNAWQTLAGLGIGVALAWSVLILSEPNVLTISLVIGLGALIGGMKWMGTGGEQVPLAALFVLIIGGPDAEGLTFGYGVQICLGIVVGLAVNLVILPPLAITPAVERLTGFKDTLATHLFEISEALSDSWPPKLEDWATRGKKLSAMAADVRIAVKHADDSRKANPRAHFVRRNLKTDFDDLTALEDVTFHIRNLTEVLRGAVWDKPLPLDFPEELRPAVSDAMHAVADVLRAEGSDTHASEPFDQAEEAIQEILHRMDEHVESGAATVSPAAAIVMDLKRILVALRPKIEREANT